MVMFILFINNIIKLINVLFHLWVKVGYNFSYGINYLNKVNIKHNHIMDKNQ